MKNTKAFSLFELVLVVFLLGSVYALVLFQPSQGRVPKNRYDTLKLFDKGDTKIVVYDECSKVARFSKDGAYSFAQTSPFPKDLKVYKINYMSELELKTFEDVKIQESQEEACMVLNRYPNGTVDPLVLQIKERFFVLGPFEDEISEVEDLQEAKKLLIDESLLPIDSSRLNHE